MAKTTSDAVEILRGRYVKDDAERIAAVQTERANAEIARLIYTMRTEASLTQRRLAELVGTTQSVISRLEDSDYEGHSLSMLHRIAEALQKKVTVVITAKHAYAERFLGGTGVQAAIRALCTKRIPSMPRRDSPTDSPPHNQTVMHDESICRRLAAGFRRAPIE